MRHRCREVECGRTTFPLRRCCPGGCQSICRRHLYDAELDRVVAEGMYDAAARLATVSLFCETFHEGAEDVASQDSDHPLPAVRMSAARVAKFLGMGQPRGCEEWGLDEATRRGADLSARPTRVPRCFSCAGPARGGKSEGAVAGRSGPVKTPS